MAPRGYPAEFWRRVIDLVEVGRPVATVARNQMQHSGRELGGGDGAVGGGVACSGA